MNQRTCHCVVLTKLSEEASGMLVFVAIKSPYGVEVNLWPITTFKCFQS